MKIGTCSWTDPTLLESGWYPERVAKDPEARLRYYAERFPIVENDAAYYALPDPKQALLWTERTPDGFTMSFKAFAPITTHPTDPKRLPKDLRESLPAEAREKKRLYSKDLPTELLEEIHTRYWTALEPLRRAGKLGAILLQYPDWSVFGRETMEAILRARELLPDDPLAVEFRNATWLSDRNREETLRFLSEHELTYVSVDEPQGFPSSVPPITAVTNESLAVIRFHGRNAENWKKKGITAAERFDYRYSKQELLDWVPRIREVAKQAREVHLLMNNCYGDKAVNNAAELGELLFPAA
ncbi:MAG: hypothetical protein A3G84_00060 [Chloroflexi bacterium RIFCSPLOWO2_12_FULL_71_12]|nr:MAG: hypothetical protein A3G84_00060 [Chloroflexi bacterium RIFCSPLOWO2_12_FULL_71_12]